MRFRAVTGVGAQRESYTVIGEDNRVVEPVDDFLAMCTDRECSPNTIRARAYDVDYLFAEYGELDSDYVFVNLWEAPVGHTMTYWGVMSLVKRHRHRWTRLGRPPLAELPAAVERLRYPGVDLADLPPLLRLEFGYLLQLRTDQRRTGVLISEWDFAIRVVLATGVESVRDRSLEFWQQQVKRRGVARGLFRTILEGLHDLHDHGSADRHPGKFAGGG